MKSFRLKIFLFIICFTFYYAACFYFPVSTPIEYCEESNATGNCQSRVMLYVGKLNSEETTFPYDYNYFDFCSAYESESFAENLIQVIFGEKIRLSPYDITFIKDVDCALLCQKTYNLNIPNDVAKINILKKGMHNNYQHHWIVDNMPVTWCYASIDESYQFCSTGFPMGCYVNSVGWQKDSCIMSSKFSKPDTFYLFNHVDLMIQYQSVEESHRNSFNDNKGRILRIKVQPRSIKNQLANVCSANSDPMDIANHLKANTLTINYTYSVKFVKDNTLKWSSRWDYLLSIPYGAQWFSTINSFVVFLFLTGVVTIIFFRILHKDLVHNKQAEFVTTSKSQKIVGWKLLHGDVFRPPQRTMLLSVLLGSGVQIIFTASNTLLFAYLGFLCPSNERGLVTFAMVSYVCFGSSAGYVSARLYKAFGGVTWKLNGVLTSTLCSGCILVFILLMNLILWAKGSANATSFTILVTLLLLWFGLSFLLTFAGAYCGFKKRIIDHPVLTNKIPRQIPKQPICNRSLISIMRVGILPFICIFYQLFLILNSVWSSQVYYMFGYLIVVFLMFIIVCSETAILHCYLLLQTENYHWWWSSFLASGFTGVYVFLYCIFFFLTKLNISDCASTFLYFGYTLLMVILFSLLSGTIGFFACFWFVRKIYGALKYYELTSSAYTIFPSSLNNECTEKVSVHGEGKFEKHVEKSNKLDTPWCTAFHLRSNDISSYGCIADGVKTSDFHGVVLQNQK